MYIHIMEIVTGVFARWAIVDDGLLFETATVYEFVQPGATIFC